MPTIKPAAAVPAPAAAAPTGEYEELVARMWREVLKVEHIGPDDSFFELGGDSMAGAQVARRLTKHLGVRIPLRVIFDLPTMRDVAVALERAAPSGSAGGAPVTAVAGG